MILGLVQSNIVWEKKQENTEKMRKYIELFNAHAKDCAGERLLLFPEMSLTGFSMNTEMTAELHKETVHAVHQLSGAYNVSLGVGWVQGADGKALCENHYSIITPDGGDILDYAKLHPFSYSGEDRFFRGGDRLCACQFGDMRIGVAICFDLRFPEIFQILSDCVDMIVVPANWPEKRSRHWRTLLEARAIENQCYIAGINCCGMMDDTYYSGDSCLYDAGGGLVVPEVDISMKDTETGAGDISDAAGAICFADEERLLIYHIKNNVSSVRETFPVKAERRNELYGKLEVQGLE